MSDTPRTDDLAITAQANWGDEQVVSADFARQLERELNEARAATDRLRGALEYLAKHCTCYETDWAGDYAKRALADAP